MTDYGRDALELDDEDRLPWLEPAVEPGQDGGGASLVRMFLLIAAGLALLALIVGGVFAVRKAMESGGGDGKLIAAPEGSYKIPASEEDARKFEGEGDASYATSEGVAQPGVIDTSRIPEAPVATASSAANSALDRAASATKPARTVQAPVESVAAPKTGAAASGAASGASSGHMMIQLGAYGSEQSARDAWTKLSKRFSYLAPLTMAIQPVEVAGAKLYRLRAQAGNAAQANTLCGKLKVAGESCMVVS